MRDPNDMLHDCYNELNVLADENAQLKQRNGGLKLSLSDAEARIAELEQRLHSVTDLLADSTAHVAELESFIEVAPHKESCQYGSRQPIDPGNYICTCSLLSLRRGKKSPESEVIDE